MHRINSQHTCYMPVVFRHVLILSFAFSLSFCSRPKPTKTILLLAPKEHFGLYTGEILKTEGFNHFVLDSTTDDVTVDYLVGFDLVILTQTKVSEQLTTILTSYVSEGGNLI